MVYTPELRDWDTFDWHDWNVTQDFLTSKWSHGTHRKSHIVPLCGWKWITGRQHIVPVCKLEVEYKGVRHSMTIRSASIKDIVKAIRAEPNKTNGRLRFTRNKLGGLVAPLPAKV